MQCYEFDEWAMFFGFVFIIVIWFRLFTGQPFFCRGCKLDSEAHAKYDTK